MRHNGPGPTISRAEGPSQQVGGLLHIAARSRAFAPGRNEWGLLRAHPDVVEDVDRGLKRLAADCQFYEVGARG